MRNNISACLIVKDEEYYIEKCLKSLRDRVDEIIVVDTGSKDRTVELASKNADKILHFKWINDFSAARNFSIENAKHDFVYISDADEAVFEWDTNSVQDFIEKNRTSTVGFVNIINKYVMNGEEKTRSQFETRLFNRHEYHYEGIIHEQIVQNNGGKFERVKLNIKFLHTGYNTEDIERKNKAARNIGMLQQALKQKGDDCYLLYQLGKGYDAAKDYAKAVECYKKAIDLIENIYYQYVEELIISYGYDLLRINDNSGAMVIEKYRDCFSHSPEYNFILAYIYMMNGLFNKSISLFLRCTELKDGETEGITSWMPLYNVGVIYECTNNKNEALKYYTQCGNYPKAQQRIAAILQGGK